MGWDHIGLEVAEGTATITLDRPEALNAFAGSMRVDLLEAIENAASTADVRLIVITGAGTAFCAGGDVKFMAQSSIDDVTPLIEQGKRVVRTLAALPIPTMAAVNGIAVGAGLGLALACDLRVAAQSARLGASFARVGLHPDWGASYSLTRLAGPAVARELVFSGRLVDAAEACTLGLVNEVVPDDELPAAVRSKAEQLRESAPLAVAHAKRTLALAEHVALDSVLDAEQAAQIECLKTDDAREGLNAFVEKRVPLFRGR